MATIENNEQLLDKFISMCSQIAFDKFKIQNLYTNQIQVLQKIYPNCSCVIATLPTGSGKTLLYALPALAWTSGTILVLSPLISLMRDQMRRMQEAEISSVIFTSDQTEEERKEAYIKINNNIARIIFASPERFVMPSFTSMLAKLDLNMLVVDEAHCVVTWGPAFRPEYADLSKFIKKVNPKRILAITATAGKLSRKWIVDKVFPKDSLVVECIGKPIRDNVFVRVIRVKSEDEKSDRLFQIIREYKFQRAIIYFTKRELCDTMAMSLQSKKILSVSYHAGLERNKRRETEEFIYKSTQKLVICATQAFGMGVDLSNVHLVIVYGFPNGIEEYFQMIGRAGRNGENAQSILLWTGADPRRRFFHFEHTYPRVSNIEHFVKAARSCFTTKHSTCLVEFNKVVALMPGSGEQQKKEAAESMLVALRMIELAYYVPVHERYFEIKFCGKKTPQQLFDELPSGISRRALFLKTIQDYSNEIWFNNSFSQIAMSVQYFCDCSRLQWIQCEEILNYYSSKSEILWCLHPKAEYANMVVFKNSYDFAIKSLVKYSALRNNFFKSIEELDIFARSTKCRMQSSELFFGMTTKSVLNTNNIRITEGASAYNQDLPSKKSNLCLHCDNCTNSHPRELTVLT